MKIYVEGSFSCVEGEEIVETAVEAEEIVANAAAEEEDTVALVGIEQKGVLAVVDIHFRVESEDPEDVLNLSF